MTITIILFFIATGATGFIVLRRCYLKSEKTMMFTKQYRDSYIELVNEFYGTYDNYHKRGNLNSEKYMWLTKNANKMQSILGQSGIIYYVSPFQKYSVPNYHLLINTLPKFREKLLHESEVNMVDDALLRKYGILEEVVNSKLKELRHPFVWFKQGFKEMFSLPFYIINWFGIIPDKIVGRITSNIIFNIIVGIGSLITFLSGMVKIIQGKEATIHFFKTLLHK